LEVILVTIRIAIAVFSILLLCNAASANDPPAWLLDAARIATPSFEFRETPGYILRNEQSVTVGPDGRVVRTRRYAVRVLTREGRDLAIARVIYTTSSDRVRDLNAWTIAKSEPKPRHFGKKEVLDLALASNDLYNEAREKRIDASYIVRDGDVFGYESVTEERDVFSQFVFSFQRSLPVASARFSLTLPPGWDTESVTFNREKVEPLTTGTTHVWELRDLPPLRPEPRSPGWSAVSPRLAVSIFPPSGTSAGLRTFRNWNDVARWMAELAEDQAKVNDDLAAKVHELTANAKTEFEKIRAIGRYVQQIQYISIQLGTGRGGGYKPRPATEVFARSYGDCKDKANLMRAMLSVLKIPAFLVSITADDPNYVRVEWASPHQFNHCIIAIKIGDDTEAAAVVKHSTLGRLLMFDPTDPYTALGDIPEEQQGSYALIDHRDVKDLVKMPSIPAEHNRLERHIEASLGSTGDISAKIRETSVGQTATGERSRLRRNSSSDYEKIIHSWVNRGVAGALTSRISTKDDMDHGKFELEVEFASNSFAQLMQNRLMVFRPTMVGRLDRLSYTDGRRTQAYVVDSSSYRETVEIKLPAGFVVDEMPDIVTLETPFGKYSASYEEAGNKVIFRRSLDMKRTTVPVGEYESVRTFFAKVHSTEQSQIVLIRK
jgi:hypothetical protein